MPGSTIGTKFKVTTWGESHGPAIGAIVEGCPAKFPLSEKDIQIEIDHRKPKAKSKISTTRREEDKVKILSGVPIISHLSAIARLAPLRGMEYFSGSNACPSTPL